MHRNKRVATPLEVEQHMHRILFVSGFRAGGRVQSQIIAISANAVVSIRRAGFSGDDQGNI